MDRAKEKTYNIGLLFSGGGARGFAHPGEVKELLKDINI